MSNQSGRQAAIRGQTSTAYSFAGDWHALFDSAGIAAGPYNGRLLAWINQTLGTTYTDLPGAQAALAASRGVSDWNALDQTAFAGIFE